MHFSGEQKFDGPRIRAHLVESSERQRDIEYAAAEEATPSAERQRQREAAAAGHQARLPRIDEIVARFAELDGRADISKVSRELTRILTEEGVDATLAYADAQKPRILAEARTLQAAERDRLRTKLEPLLSAANLQANKGQTVAARAAYRELLALDPAWPAVLESAAMFLHDQTILNRTHGTLAAAFADAEESNTLATRLHTAYPTVPNVQRLLTSTHIQMGNMLIKRGHDGDADKALGHYTRGFELAEALLKTNPASIMEMWNTSVGLNSLGDFLATRGQPGDADKALGYHIRSLELAEAALKANPASAQAKRHLTVSLNSLGEFFVKRGQPGDVYKALSYGTRSLELREALLKANPGSDDATRDVMASLDRVGDFHARMNLIGDTEKALFHFTRCIELSEKRLKAIPNSAQAKRDLSIVLEKLGDLLAKHGQAGDAEKTLECFARCNDLRELLFKANPGSAQATREVSISLNKLGDFLAIRGKPGDADTALGYFTRCNDLLDPLLRANPGSAQATKDVVVSHYKLAGFALSRGEAKDEEKHSRTIYDLLKPAIERGMTFDPPIVQLYEDLKARFSGK